ncbi:hypothetical protein BDF19DRAFT_407822 [Syncephalis fuscata]|nr:hypothetical protein BDF19DRAFT_407822 [Syncephalis fuscata]
MHAKTPHTSSQSKPRGRPSSSNKENYGMSDYELQRQENIARNQEMLKALNIEAIIPKGPKDTGVATPNSVDKGRRSAKRQRTTPKIIDIATPRRASARLRGGLPSPLLLDPDQSADSDATAVNYMTDDLEGVLRSADEYLDDKTKACAVKVDGHFRGWVNEALIEKYGLEASAAEAWEKNGGGTFSFDDPLGNGTKRKLSRKVAGGVSEARLVSKQLFKKNPNAYFYRHNEPGEEQWTGDWSKEEEDLFVEVAKTYGCGDKWGLFASYIPHRVGYQCSNHYRQVILPSGRIIDPNYRFTSSGHAIYIGFHRRPNSNSADD